MSREMPRRAAWVVAAAAAVVGALLSLASPEAGLAVLGLEVRAAPRAPRLVDIDRVAARDEFAAHAAQEMRVAVVPVGDQRMAEHYDAHAVSRGRPARRQWRTSRPSRATRTRR